MLLRLPYCILFDLFLCLVDPIECAKTCKFFKKIFTSQNFKNAYLKFHHIDLKKEYDHFLKSFQISKCLKFIFWENSFLKECTKKKYPFTNILITNNVQINYSLNLQSLERNHIYTIIYGFSFEKRNNIINNYYFQ